MAAGKVVCIKHEQYELPEFLSNIYFSTDLPMDCVKIAYSYLGKDVICNVCSSPKLDFKNRIRLGCYTTRSFSYILSEILIKRGYIEIFEKEVYIKPVDVVLQYYSKTHLWHALVHTIILPHYRLKDCATFIDTNDLIQYICRKNRQN